jgi:hypothetical protein
MTLSYPSGDGGGKGGNKRGKRAVRGAGAVPPGKFSFWLAGERNVSDLSHPGNEFCFDEIFRLKYHRKKRSK